MKKIIILISIALAITSCEELDVDIQELEKTDFTLTTSATEETIVINENIEFNLSIGIEEPITENLDFSMIYFDTGISGTLSIDGANYTEGETISNISNGNMVLNYQGETAGSGNLNFQVTASNGIIKNIAIPVTVQDTDFEFEVLFDKKEGYVNDFTSFNIDIQKMGIENLTYEAYFTNVVGLIKFLDSDREISQNQKFNINEGNSLALFKGTSVQDGEIEFVIKASNGVVKKQKIKYNILPTDFKVIIDPIPIRAFYQFNAFFEINIISPNVKNQSIKYHMRYFTDIGESTSLKLLDIDEPNGTANLYDFKTRNYSRATIDLLGNREPVSGNITFIFTDSNGIEVIKTVPLEFYDN